MNIYTIYVITVPQLYGVCVYSIHDNTAIYYVLVGIPYYTPSPPYNAVRANCVGEKGIQYILVIIHKNKA